MDFRQTTQPTGRPANTPVAATPTPAGAAPHPPTPPSPEKNITNKWFRILSIAVLFGVAVLILGIALVFTRTSTNSDSNYINTSKYQAVFLNNGQVYFGKITSMSSKSIVLGGVYYLTQATSTDAKATASGNYTLVKLGCQQIHDPIDQMIINRDQVTFWENLSDDGQVAKKVAEFKKTYPNGPDCSQVSNQTQADTSTTQGGTAPTNTTTKP